MTPEEQALWEPFLADRSNKELRNQLFLNCREEAHRKAKRYVRLRRLSLPSKSPDWDDLYAEVDFALLKGLPKYDDGRAQGEPSRYIWTIASHAAYHWMEQRAGAKEVQTPAWQNEDGQTETLLTVTPDPHDEELPREMRSEIEALSPRLRSILMERFWNKRSLAEIGERLNLCEKIVSRGLAKALAILRQRLGADTAAGQALWSLASTDTPIEATEEIQATAA